MKLGSSFEGDHRSLDSTSILKHHAAEEVVLLFVRAETEAQSELGWNQDPEGFCTGFDPAEYNSLAEKWNCVSSQEDSILPGLCHFLLQHPISQNLWTYPRDQSHTRSLCQVRRRGLYCLGLMSVPQKRPGVHSTKPHTYLNSPRNHSRRQQGRTKCRLVLDLRDNILVAPGATAVAEKEVARSFP